MYVQMESLGAEISRKMGDLYRQTGVKGKPRGFGVYT